MPDTLNDCLNHDMASATGGRPWIQEEERRAVQRDDIRCTASTQITEGNSTTSSTSIEAQFQEAVCKEGPTSDPGIGADCASSGSDCAVAPFASSEAVAECLPESDLGVAVGFRDYGRDRSTALEANPAEILCASGSNGSVDAGRLSMAHGEVHTSKAAPSLPQPRHRMRKKQALSDLTLTRVTSHPRPSAIACRAQAKFAQQKLPAAQAPPSRRSGPGLAGPVVQRRRPTRPTSGPTPAQIQRPCSSCRGSGHRSSRHSRLSPSRSAAQASEAYAAPKEVWSIKTRSNSC